MAQAAAYSAVQTLSALRAPPGPSRTLPMLSWVTTVGVNSSDGVPNSVVLPFGVSPWTNAWAALAAASATILIGLEIVLYWSPAMIRCAAAVRRSVIGDHP